MSGFRIALAALAGLTLSSTAFATPVGGLTNLVVDGDFETTTNGSGEIVPGHTGSGYTQAQTATGAGWSDAATNANAGYPFLFIAAAGTATTTGFPDPWDNGVRHLWGAANGGANTWDGTSVDGGNFLIADGDYHATPITQLLAGLHAGDTYTLSFDWAAGQWYGNTGATTEKFIFGVGDKTSVTNTYQLPSTGFSGWMHQTFTFNYDGSSSLLSFLAAGTPVGEPPMLLLDGVALYDVPEPAAWTILLAGLTALAFAASRRPMQASKRA